VWRVYEEEDPADGARYPIGGEHATSCGQGDGFISKRLGHFWANALNDAAQLGEGDILRFAQLGGDLLVKLRGHANS